MSYMHLEVNGAPTGATNISVDLPRSMVSFSKRTPIRSNIVGVLTNKPGITPGLRTDNPRGIHTLNLSIAKLSVHIAAKLVYILMNYPGYKLQILDYYNNKIYTGVFSEWSYTENQHITKQIKDIDIDYTGDPYSFVDGTASYPIKPSGILGANIRVVTFDFQGAFLSETINDIA